MEIGEENGHIAVDMRWLSSYESLVNMDDLARADKPSIFEIPRALKRDHETAYLPDAFSFGPLHYGKPGLEAGQAIKFRFLQDIFLGYRDPRTKLAEVESAVREKLVEVRQCYATQVEVLGDDEKFVKILVLDGCFIVEWFFILNSNKSDQLNAYLHQCLYRDLILLENQIPWSVLVLLSNLLFKDHGNLKLHEGAIRFIRNMFSLDGRPIPHAFLQIGKIKHILDLLRNCFFLSFLGEEKIMKSSLSKHRLLPLLKCLQKLLKAPKEKDSELEIQVPPASRLKEAGVKFKIGKQGLDIKFQKGVLEIPPLLIDEVTEAIFRNLIAFEQCYRDCLPIVTSYARFMDDLIDRVEDLDVLHKNGIICCSNPEDATKFFNSLSNGNYMGCNLYAEVCGQLNRYSQRRWPRWRAFYIHNYFGKPWAIFSQIFAFLILALTILQVIQK